jgi:hypothetical protein
MATHTLTDLKGWLRRHLPRISRLVVLVLLAQLVAHVVVSQTVRSARGEPEPISPQQAIINERQRYIMDDFNRRLMALENERYASRMAVLESDMSEVKWLGRGLALAIFGQLSLTVMSWRRRQQSETDA